MIRLSNVQKSFGVGPSAVQAVKHADVELAPGRVVALYGPNGAGKTTLLRCIAGTCLINGGSIDLDESAGLIGYVPEGGRGFYPNLSFRQNLGWASRLAATPMPLPELLAMFPSIDELLGGRRPARTLSRGQKQLLSIAVAVTRRPGYLLLDEPFNGLDFEAYSKVTEAIRHLSRSGVGVLISTHELKFIELADDLIFMSNGVCSSVVLKELFDREFECTISLEEEPGSPSDARVVTISGTAAEVVRQLRQVDAANVAKIYAGNSYVERLYREGVKNVS